MAKGLDRQVYLYSLDTSAFYTDEENVIHMKLLNLYRIKSLIKNKMKKLNSSPDPNNESKTRLQKGIKSANRLINKYKESLIKILNSNNSVRVLRDDNLKIKNLIGMFDSALSRTIGMKIDEVSEELMVVRVYYYQILNDLINNGYLHNGEKYIYFSSSAGQIRTKKGVFIKESTWLKHEKTLTCGLSLEEINEKGGCNVNKLLAYKALIASASQKWDNFNIDETIVVPDLETTVRSMFDYINRETYEITPQMMDVSIEHTDGCGMILPRKSKKSFMIRLPYIKGLLAPFPFDKFCEQFGKNKVTDIYGKEWDIIEDGITTIFTASQFKMKKYYDDWDDYKKRFKQNRCQAVKLNEEDIGEDATTNYQMLQTLTDVTVDELKELANDTIEDILKVGSDKETMLRILGATKTNKRKNYYQQALSIYPELLNDEHSKKIIKDKKKSMVNDARAGKLRINGKYIFLIPDLYAFCEKLFLGEVNPKGLLKNGEVFCNVYDNGKVDILRSPHLYKEHAVRINMKDEEKAKWFVTNGIYTSIFDPISKMLQFDNDGDKALVVQNELFVKIAEKNMKGVLPLYYEMGAAKAEQITNDKIYESLLLAFKANIGEVSNNITKVFNSNNIDIRVVKWLTAENNYIIDFAKTLFLPKRPHWVDEIIKGYIKSKVPYFFIEAKEKEKKNVEPINRSTVNRLRKVIPNKRIKFEDIAGTVDYRMLMSDEVERTDYEIIAKYKELEKSKRRLIRETIHKNRRESKFYVDMYIRGELKKINSDENRIVNILVDELYNRQTSKNKTTLWDCYGDILLMNIRENIKGLRQCENCGERTEIINNQTKYCNTCASEVKKRKTRERVHKHRKRNALEVS